MSNALSIDELSERAGEHADTLRSWQQLELLPTGDTFGIADLERVKLIQTALQRGVTPEAVARASAEQGDLVRYYGDFVRDDDLVPARSLDELAEALGIDRRLLERLSVAAGLNENANFGSDDVEALQGLKLALDVGFPEDALSQLVRVYADALGRVADAETRLFHMYVHEGLSRSGLQGAELNEASREASRSLMPLVEPSLLYFHRRAWERALREDIVGHLVEGSTSPSKVPGQVDVAVLFVDLASFTPLTEAMGDIKASEVVDRFSDLVRFAAVECEGKVIKQIGDAFMLVFRDPAAAVRCGTNIQERAASEPQFPAVRLGAHYGPALYRDGDYVGSTVNIAARLAAAADRNELVVTKAVRDAASGVDHVVFARAGRRRLKGLFDELELHVARAPQSGAEKVTDPVCGIELVADSAAARLTVDGRDLFFCCGDCLSRFLDSNRDAVDA